MTNVNSRIETLENVKNKMFNNFKNGRCNQELFIAVCDIIQLEINSLKKGKEVKNEIQSISRNPGIPGSTGSSVRGTGSQESKRVEEKQI